MSRSKLLTIETVTQGNELLGEPPETWSEFGKVWGSIDPLTGREYIAAQQVNSQVSHKITTEFIRGTNSQMRLRYGERVFEVESVVNVKEANRELEWMCKEST